MRRVFVFSDGNDRFAMLPIELTDDEMRSITPESIDAFPTTEMWKENRAGPEGERREAQVNREPAGGTRSWASCLHPKCKGQEDGAHNQMTPETNPFEMVAKTIGRPDSAALMGLDCSV